MRILRWIGITAVVLLGIPIAALAVVVMLGVPISLDAFRANIEAAAEETLGRVVEIEGPLISQEVPGTCAYRRCLIWFFGRRVVGGAALR